MLRNFFSVFRQYKLSFLLNIIGFSLAVTVAYALLVQVNYNLGFNRGIKDVERLFVVESMVVSEEFSPHLCTPLARIMAVDNPTVASYHYGSLDGNDVDHTFEKFPDEPLVLKGMAYNEGSLETLGVELVQGDFEPVTKRHAMAFSCSVAERYGLQIGDRVCWGREYTPGGSLTVGAIFEDFPENSDFCHIQALYGPYVDAMSNNSWRDWWETLIVKLRSVDDKERFFEHILSQTLLIDEPRLENLKTLEGVKENIRLLPLADVYFASDHINRHYQSGSKVTTYALLSMAVVVMLIAYINFFNLFVALIPRRIRAVNIRKISGELNSSIRLKLFLEAVVLLLCAFALSFFLLYFIEGSPLRDYLSVSLFAPCNVPLVVTMAAVSLLLIIIVAIYPAFYLTSFPPAFVLKGSFSATKSGKMMRNILVGLQFVFSFVFVIIALFVSVQMSFIRNHDLGFDRDGILLYDIPAYGLPDSYRPEKNEPLRDALMASPYIKDVAFSQSLIVDAYNGWSRHWSQNPDETLSFKVIGVSPNFLDVLGIKIFDGCSFTAADGSEPMCMFNAAAKEQYNMNLGDWFLDSNKRHYVVGFFDNINFKSLYTDSNEPFAYVSYPLDKGYFKYAYIKIHEGSDLAAVTEHIARVSREFSGGKGKEYRSPLLLDDYINNTIYRREAQFHTLIMGMSVISIIISLLGVFGLVFFETQYRQKEIALRRVHGAQISSVLLLFCKRFVKIMLVCFALALPVAIYIVNLWLQNFAYKTPLHLWVFLSGFFIVALLTLAIVVVSAWNTVNRNPVAVLSKE